MFQSECCYILYLSFPVFYYNGSDIKWIRRNINPLGQLSLFPFERRDLLKNLTILEVGEYPGSQRCCSYRGSFCGFLLETFRPLLDQLGNRLQTRWCASSRVPRSKSNKDVITFFKLAWMASDDTDDERGILFANCLINFGC